MVGQNSGLERWEVTSPVRVKVSEGEAEFPSVLTDGLCDNEVAGGRWITLPKGSLVVTVASYERTDTYMLEVQLSETVHVGLDDGAAEVTGCLGLVLRRASFSRVLAASKRLVPGGERVAEDAQGQQFAAGSNPGGRR